MAYSYYLYTADYLTGASYKLFKIKKVHNTIRELQINLKARD